ncbi:MAG: DegV family protein [Lachnospiraceae bacterium]|nr:DegV family protein [Lachnospiraceae bacterium]
MVQIITDSSTLYTPDEARALGFEAVPLCVSIGDFDGRDLLLDMKDFYARIERGEIPKSSQPPIGEVLDVFEKYSDCEIINISMADGLSGTYQSACGVREMIDNNEHIHVINSTTLCGPHRYMVEKAQKMKEDGCSAKEILDWLDYAATTHESFLIPQDFAFLRRGGRLTPMAAAIGSVLKIKPVMTQTPDSKKLDKFTIKRTLKAAVQAVIKQMKEKGVDSRYIVHVSHAEAFSDAKKVMGWLAEEFPDVEIQMLDLGAAFVTQGGPQCVAIQYIEK